MILESKLEIPDEEEKIILKPKLGKLFEQTSVPCTVVKAMSGFGKTSVLAALAKRSHSPVYWYTLDITDNNSSVFLSCLESIWEKAEGEGFQRADPGHNRYLQVQALAARAQSWKRHIYLVVDNLQVIHSEEVLGLFFFLQSYTEGKVFFLVLTNQEMPKGFLPLFLKGKGQLVAEDSLRLTTEEAWTCFGRGSGLSESLVNEAVEGFCGWPIGIRYVVRYLCTKRQGRSIDWNKVLQESFLPQYLDMVLWEQSTEEVREFLKWTALTGEFSWESCQAVLQERVSRCIFDKAVSCYGIFYHVPGKKDTYQCGKAFRTYLERMLPAEERAVDSVLSLPYPKNRGKEKLKVYTFGSFQVIGIQDGKRLPWRTRKGRELFAYLLDSVGQAADRRKLLELLWQEEIPDNAVSMLHNMIYNIRKELSAYGMETALTYKDRQYRLLLDGMVCDFFHIKQIAGLVEQKNVKGLRKEYKNFLTYWGGYLEEIDSIWAREKRLYYDEIYKRGCWMLAEQFRKEKNTETALVLYKNILLLEPYSEKAMAEVLSLYGEQKKWENVKQSYRDFKEIMEKDLGIAPGEEVLRVYHSYLKIV